MEVITLALRRQVFWLAAGILLPIGQAAFFVYRGGLSSVPTVSYAMILFFPLYGLYLWRRREQDKILLWQDGLQVIKKSTAGPVFSWQDIRVAKHSIVNGYAILHMRNGDRVTLFDRKFFGSHRRTEEFVKSINDRRPELQGGR